MRVRAIDLFCGAGGSSWGARQAGVEILAGFDAWALAGQAYLENFSEARFYESFLEDLDPERIHGELGSIDLLLASPECTNHSPAKGKGPRCEKSKATAFQVIRFARVFQPRWIVVENVTSMRAWTRYAEFVGALRSLGYHVTPQILNAKEFGVPQSRRRLFLMCDRDREPESLRPRAATPIPAHRILEQNGRFVFSPLLCERRAPATIERAERAIAAVGDQPFLLVYYGSDKAGGWQDLQRPLRTVTTLDRFAYVKCEHGQRMMRMLQVPELKAAMGMPKKFSLGQTTRRNGIRLLGNAVCPPVMRAVVRHLVQSRQRTGAT